MKILIGYDGSSGAETALEDLQRAGLPAKSEALVVSVTDGSLRAPDETSLEADSDDSWRSRLAAAERLAERAAIKIQAYFPQWTISKEGLWGHPAEILLDAAGWWHPDVIVVGSHG